MIRSGHIFAPVFLLTAALSTLLFAGEPQVIWQGTLTQKSKAIEGNVRIESADGAQTIVFGSDFKTKNGPDLKIVLSPQPFTQVNGKNAMADAKVVSLLKAISGSQRYVIPAGVDLTAMKSLLIHCEKYSVLWGGTSLD